ncbi:hypothetical protein [Xanthomonas melonis]|uniref:hypothetical protein n=1 Tax=Xanthomonas melonis TaxID=56456 RepID=UPI003EBEEFAF
MIYIVSSQHAEELIGMGANHRKAYVACAGLLCALVAGCASPGSAIASQAEHPGQPTAKSPAVSCPSKDFGTFLQRYADPADDSVRRQFTDEPLEYEVPTYTVEEETASSPITHISRHTGRSRLDLFPFRYFKDAKVFDQLVSEEHGTRRQGEVGIPVSIEMTKDDGRRVDFGMEYEMDTYVFRRGQGCWHLTRAVNLRD